MDPTVLVLLTAAASAGVVVRLLALSKGALSAPLEGALMGATYVAMDRRHGELLPEHFLVAAMLDDEVAELVKRWGIAPSAASRALLDRLDAATTPAPAAAPQLSAPLIAALQKAKRGRGAVALPAVVEEFEPLFTALRAELPDEPETAPASTDYRARGNLQHIVFHDNPRTTVDTVVAVLVDVLGIDRTRALCHAYRIHCVGESSVGAWPTGDAIELAERARIRSADLGFPLEITTRATFVAPRKSLVQRLRRRARDRRWFSR